MPAFEPFLDLWQTLCHSERSEESSSTGSSRPFAALRVTSRSAIEKAARAIQVAIDSARPGSPLIQDLVGVRSPFWVNNRDEAKYLSSEAQASLAKMAQELASLQNSAPPLPCAHGIEEGGLRFSLYPGFQDAPIHLRGSYEQLGPRVPRHFPRVLAGDEPSPIRKGSGRLELAQWIACADHPLTARVMVNRIWQHHFEEGLVRTPSNFGRLGAPPTHPELLDFLAKQFVASGWSIKTMHRLILLSATYQQSSHASPESLRLDPENLLLGRMNRRRLEAEAVRDGLLAVSGRLNLKPGGPAEHDSSSPRRMLYLNVSRGDRAGFAALFDGANASIHVEKRTLSTVAPQALFLMNNNLVAESARLLANRQEIAALDKPEERIQALYRLVYGRRATVEEIDMGCRFIREGEAGGTGVSPVLGLDRRDAGPTGKGSAGASPFQGSASPSQGLAPWESYAQALLLSNEFLFVD
jgi:hypothetical protein